MYTVRDSEFYALIIWETSSAARMFCVCTEVCGAY